MDSLIQTFHIDGTLMLAQLVNFALVFLVLYYFALRPLQKIMKERTRTIEKGLDDAKNSATSLEEARRQAQELLNQARAQAQELLTQARKDADEKRVAALNQAKKEVEQIVINGKNQLAQEKLAMVESAKSEVVELVVQSLNKVLGATDLSSLSKESLQSILNKNNKS